MKYTFLLLFFVSASLTNAQLLHRDSLVGEWNCKEVKLIESANISNDMKNEVEMMKAMFAEARFIFKADGKFYFDLPKAPAEVRGQMKFLNNQIWTFNPSSNNITIGQPKDNLMQIDISNVNSIITFVLSDTPLYLTVAKKTSTK